MVPMFHSTPPANQALRRARFAGWKTGLRYSSSRPVPHAEAIQRFYQEYFNPYLNFHRPCGVPERVSNAKGKEKRVYRWYATPWEILRQLPDVARHLKPEITIESLEQRARADSDTKAARKMQQSKRELFAKLRQKKTA